MLQKLNPNETLYMINVVFNPFHFKTRYKLFKEFQERTNCEKNLKALVVEIAFVDEEFHVTDSDNPWHVQLRTSVEMWHKEKALNIALKRLMQLAPDAKYVAWVDADVWFTNPYFVKDTITALKHYCIVQMFSEAQNLAPDYRSQWKCPGLFYNYVNKVGYHQHPPKPLKYLTDGHPGLAWAGRIETLHQLGGLIDFCIHGSGDTHMANALMGDVMHALSPNCSPGFNKALQLWGDKCNKHVKLNVGYVNGICYHYWHGKPSQRGYEKRLDIIAFHQFDPYTDISEELSGLYRFTEDKPHLRLDLRKSMIGRSEDSIDE
jgi:hypothetical protein